VASWNARCCSSPHLFTDPSPDVQVHLSQFYSYDGSMVLWLIIVHCNRWRLLLSCALKYARLYKYKSEMEDSTRTPSIHAQCISSSPPPPLCSGSSLMIVSIRMIATQASTALFNCFTLLTLGSSTPILSMSMTLPCVRSSP